jgi:hypothetical protein
MRISRSNLWNPKTYSEISYALITECTEYIVLLHRPLL